MRSVRSPFSSKQGEKAKKESRGGKGGKRILFCSILFDKTQTKPEPFGQTKAMNKNYNNKELKKMRE